MRHPAPLIAFTLAAGAAVVGGSPVSAQQEPAAATQPATQPGDAAAAAPDAAPDAAQDAADLSYAIGYMVGREYHRNDVQLDPEVFAQGLEAGMTGGEGRMSQEELQNTLMQFQREMQLRQMQQMQAQAAAGQAYLQENRQKEGVQVSESGLQYEVLEEGQGESPDAQDTVRVHYRGTLPDGTQFDSSYDRGEPAEFQVGGVIPGWTEALQMMKPGAKYRLVIPPDLAYGEMGRPPVIPPNSVLTFDVELLDVVEEPAAGEGQ